MTITCTFRKRFYRIICFSESNNYKAIATLKTWEDARLYCQKISGELASFSSLQEQASAGGDGAYNSYWIGLNDMKENGKYVWSDGSDLVWTHWQVFNPTNDSDYGCVYVYQTKWLDAWCGRRYPFVCKIPPSKSH